MLRLETKQHGTGMTANNREKQTVCNRSKILALRPLGCDIQCRVDQWCLGRSLAANIYLHVGPEASTVTAPFDSSFHGPDLPLSCSAAPFSAAVLLGFIPRFGLTSMRAICASSNPVTMSSPLFLALLGPACRMQMRCEAAGMPYLDA